MKRLSILMGVLTAALLTLGLGASSASATVLCKSATNPCTGGTYGKGTVIEATLKSSSSYPFGAMNCTEGSMKGEVTNPGGEGTDVVGTFSSVSFSGCGESSTLTVLKPGTFKIKSPSGGNGTLVWEGFEMTIKPSGIHCIYSGFGETTTLSLKGGETASLVASNAVLPRTGGSFVCGSRAEWTAEYTVTAPKPLYVAEK
jgi:hypothetical protein